MIIRTREACGFYYSLALLLTLEGFCCRRLTSAFSSFVSTTTREPSIQFRRSEATPQLWAKALDDAQDDDDGVINGAVNGEVSKLKQKTEERPAYKRRMKLIWCDEEEECKDAVREKAVGKYSHIILNGHATGQVAALWQDSPWEETDVPFASILLLVKPNDDELVAVAATAVQELTKANIHIFMDASIVARIEHHYGVDDHSKIHLFDARQFAVEGYGGTHVSADDSFMSSDFSGRSVVANTHFDLVCTLGGDGLLMHASMMFQGPVPPVISIAGGSLGFLTQFSTSEMVESIKIALGVIRVEEEDDDRNSNPLIAEDGEKSLDSNLIQAPYAAEEKPSVQIGMGGIICLSIRMRLECSVMNPEGIVRARFNVLNEVVIDRGSSPYLAALECFCDDVHLTTVQADGIIFATPTGSTAYSMSAGASVVHPAVPCILVTPICPHVLSFRSMVFPDHVVLRCYVPEDARSDASVAFDGKYRRELHRGDSIQIKMSQYPVPTINRADHSSDWLSSLKRNFNFNARPRQRPL